jgi:two-component system chemotaxis sensor kinase CheA
VPKARGLVEIRVEDDGNGIDLAALRASAAKRGLVPAEGAASEAELLSLLFESGVTTSRYVTDLSGRGLGLAIVREKVEKLGGSVFVESRSGVGCIVRLRLPLAFVTYRALAVRTGGQLFLLPSNSVERTLRVSAEAVRTVENRETVSISGETVGLASLAAILALPPAGENRTLSPSGDQPHPAYVLIVVLEQSGVRVGFRIDEVVGEREVLAKPLGYPLVRVRHVSGATILGGGQIVPILNPTDLIKAAVNNAIPSATPRTVEPKGKSKAVLVAEDSITTRMLLKNILDASGYSVSTAVDGLDALAQLRAGRFDLVVSDVDMPRMNGFDLTTRIRGDKKLADLPVVLVTALESREDRERGMDVGANAYLVKSRFDQSNLLETIRRLI